MMILRHNAATGEEGFVEVPDAAIDDAPQPSIEQRVTSVEAEQDQVIDAVIALGGLL